MRKLFCLLLPPLALAAALTLSACDKPAGAEAESDTDKPGADSAPGENIKNTENADYMRYMEKLGLADITAVETAKQEPELLPDGLPSFGYCAVGEVDKNGKKAAVLASNGAVVTREYDGADPAPGYVYAYETEGKYLAFTGVRMFPGFGAEYKGWVFGAYSSSRSIFYGSAYRCADDSVFFVRYGETEWRIYSGAGVLRAEGEVVKGGYLYSTDGETIDFMLLCGDCGEYGKLPPAGAAQSKIFDPAERGWDSGDITVKIAK